MSLPASNSGVRMALRGVTLCLVFGALGACGSAPRRPAAAVPVTRSSPPAAAPATVAVPGTVAPTGAPAPAPVHPEVSPAARADFERAVNVMRGGNLNEAELEFKQIALQYPQYAAPLVNVALIKRKQGELAEAEQLLKTAVARESGNAVARTELGATQSMRGEFKDAADSYHGAIAADPRYAPAWRNLGVVQDLYLGDPHSALTSFEQYKQLSGEDKPVSGWIAELHQRLGIAPVKPPAAQAPSPVAAPAVPTPAKGGN